MSKVSLALKTIRYIHDMECGKDESINKDFDIIEKELKEGEMWKAKYTMLEKEHIEVMLEKGALKKVLEIIKERCVDIRGIKETKNVHEYNFKFPTALNEFLENEEYDLLKEVLLCH